MIVTKCDVLEGLLSALEEFFQIVHFAKRLPTLHLRLVYFPHQFPAPFTNRAKETSDTPQTLPFVLFRLIQRRPAPTAMMIFPMQFGVYA